MRASLEQICNNFIYNRDTINKVFKYGDNQIAAATATSFLNHGILADVTKLTTCKKLLKENTSVFSNFRGNVEVPIVVQLSISDTPLDKLKKTIKMYALLKQVFHSSEYLVLVATVMVDMIPEEQAVNIIQNARIIYNKMKKDHPFLTSSEDVVYAILMALSDKSDDVMMEEMEVCYKKLKERFSFSNEVQALAHILSIAEGNVEEKCSKVINLYNALQDSGMKYGKHHELIALTSLAVLPVEYKVFVDDIKTVDGFLANQKGYGFFSLDNKTRLMHAAMIVSCDYTRNDTANVAAMTATLSVVAAQQAAMCAVVAASVVSATATTSN